MDHRQGHPGTHLRHRRGSHRTWYLQSRSKINESCERRLWLANVRFVRVLNTYYFVRVYGVLTVNVGGRFPSLRVLGFVNFFFLPPLHYFCIFYLRGLFIYIYPVWSCVLHFGVGSNGRYSVPISYSSGWRLYPFFSLSFSLSSSWLCSVRSVRNILLSWVVFLFPL